MSAEETVAPGANHTESFAADIDGLKTSFSQLRSDLTSLLNNAVGISKTGATAVKEQAAHAVDGVKHRLEGLKEKGVDSAEAIESKLSEHPLTTIVIAFGVGYVLGKLLSRK